jgi:mannan endo-1,4-beta-mannosidase
VCLSETLTDQQQSSEGIEWTHELRFIRVWMLKRLPDFVDPEHIRGSAEVVQLPKPFGFTEYGPHGPQNPPGDYDHLKFLAGVRKNFPRAAFFQAWSSRWGLGRNENTKQLLDDPWLINREDLPREFAAKP